MGLSRHSSRRNRSVLFSVFCLSATLLAQGPAPGAGPNPPAPLPASDAFAQWLDRQNHSGTPPFTDPQALAAGLDLARQRAAEMRSLMEQDPEQFLRRAMPDQQRARLPLQVRSLVEQRVKGRGAFSVYCAGLPGGLGQPPAGSHHGLAYEVWLNGANYRAFVFGKWRDQRTVLDAAIEGIALNDAIAVGDSPTPTEQAASGQAVAASSPSTTGPDTLLYMIARFSDETSDPIDDATAVSQVGVVSTFWLNNSAGAVSIKGLINSTQVMDIVHITLPQPASYASTYNNNFAQLLGDARTAAAAQGYNYSSYNLDVVVTTAAGFSYAGRSYIGAQGSHWVKGYTSLRTAGHELGHNLGLYHANYWRTDSTQPFGQDSNPGGYVADTSNGEWVEYGHYFSVMSAQYGGEWDDPTKPIYNPAEKVQLGWLSGAQAQYVTASGTYRLFRHDARSTVGTPRGIRIETPASDYTGYARHYWLGYRYAPWNTAQNWYQNGLEIDVAQTGYGADGSILLDMTPYSKDQSSPFYNAASPPGSWWTIDNSDKLDGALVLGRTYDDANAGIHITPVARGSNGSNEEYLDVVINLGSFSADRAPVITAFNASTNQVAVNQAVGFNVTATDPDGDTLAYSWDFDDVQIWTASGLNSPAATKSWVSPGQYRVGVRVSDMKGGVAAQSLIVTVGTPAATGEIRGRVVWSGQPVFGARVSTSTGSSQAWTDSDGTYVLTDLATPASYTLNCAAAGLTFTAQFTNPVSLASGSLYGMDFYANELLSAGGPNGYAISGQVTDPVSGVAGVEVRGGGMVTTTDASGNYQLNNLVNDTYTVVPRNDPWTFSPPSRSVTISSASSTGNGFSRVAPYSISGSFSGITAGGHNPAPTVYLSNGRSVQATAAGSGQNRYWAYTLNNVPAGQYSLSAALAAYTVVPAGFANPLNVSSNLAGKNFNATAVSIAGAITGRITQQNLPLAGVAVKASQGGLTVGSATSDSDGYYRIDNLASASTTIVPDFSGYSFSPASQSVGSVPAGGINFSAAGPNSPPTISSVTANPYVVPSSAPSTRLSAVAGGSSTLTYSWDALNAPAPVTFSANDSSSAASTSVAFQAPGTYTFRCRVTDATGLSASGNVSVTVNAGPGSMVVAPYEVQVAAGQTVPFRADAWDQLGNRTSVSATWSTSGGGAIDSSGLFSATTPGGPYTVSAIAGSLSATGQIWVAATTNAIAPAIISQPLSQAVAAGANVSFSVAVSGTTPLTCQWKLGGQNLAGATASALNRTNVQSSDAGVYSIVITNSAGSVTSAPAMLTVNNAPVLAAVPGRTLYPGGTVTITNAATDRDAPPQTLNFSLGPGAPAGATIDPASGIFSWTPSLAQAGTTNSVTVRVTDNGTPALSDAKTFLIVVTAPLALNSVAASNGVMNISWGAIPGQTYRVQYKTNLNDATWTTLTPDVTASSAIGSMTAPVGPGQKFYRVMALE